MHMSDALITPIVGGTMLAASAGVINYSVKKIETDIIENKLPYMSVVSAFVFAAQMINFAIPGTGSSGHIGGGLLLAILLGPQAGFLSMATVLLLQALFFADGGLVAFGCNLFNLGFFTCYVAYPFIYKPLSRGSKKMMMFGIVLASIVGLQMGAFSVVLQTMLSGKTALPFKEFLLFMQPIHLAIGLVEGLITAAVVSFLYDRREELVFDFFAPSGVNSRSKNYWNRRSAIQIIVIATVIVGGFLSQYASSNPDGLEWSIENAVAEAGIMDTEHVEVTSTIEMTMGSIQEKTALLPDYNFKENSSILTSTIGTSTAGITGSLLIIVIIMVSGMTIQFFRRKLH